MPFITFSSIKILKLKKNYSDLVTTYFAFLHSISSLMKYMLLLSMKFDNSDSLNI